MRTIPRVAIHVLAPVALGLGLVGCDGDLGPEAGPSSFDRIQAEVFDRNCVGCHVSGSPFAEQSGLELHAGVSYYNLVGVAPNNADARRDGFTLVDPGAPQTSLLLHKLRWDLPPNQLSYGSPMPLGMNPLSIGQVDFVREWIAAGAPRHGEVANPRLLDDTSQQNLTAFLPLAPPARGYQIHLPAFAVQPQSEREFFVYLPLGNTEEIWVNRVEVSKRPNSHHFIVSHYPAGTPQSQLPTPGEYRDIWRPDGSLDRSALAGMTYRRRVAGSQTAESDQLFPEGIAVRLPANVWLDLNSHYINRTDQLFYGEVYANLHTVDEASVAHEAHSLFLNNTQLHIPPHAPGETTVMGRSFIFGERRNIVTLTSHMHEKGQRFVIRRVDSAGVPGEVVYETRSWEHPDVVLFDPPLEMAAGEGLRSEVTYHNPTGSPVGFGLTSTDEMSIIVGYYYEPD
jgi:hypothetical protein